MTGKRRRSGHEDHGESSFHYRAMQNATSGDLHRRSGYQAQEEISFHFRAMQNPSSGAGGVPDPCVGDPIWDRAAEKPEEKYKMPNRVEVVDENDYCVNDPIWERAAEKLEEKYKMPVVSPPSMSKGDPIWEKYIKMMHDNDVPEVEHQWGPAGGFQGTLHHESDDDDPDDSDVEAEMEKAMEQLNAVQPSLRRRADGSWKCHFCARKAKPWDFPSLLRHVRSYAWS